MRNVVLFGLAVGTMAATAARAAIPVYGWGAGTMGGDGKPVCTVTSLSDDQNTVPHGSLREILTGANGNTCCTASNGCRVSFAGLSGDISTNGDLNVYQSNITIDGSTASGHGIQFYGWSLNLYGSNVIVTQLRHRGNSYGTGNLAALKNNIDVLCGVGVVLDHVSLEWSNYKNLGIAGYNGICDKLGLPFPRNITVQNSILAQSLISLDTLVDGDVAQVTFYHDIIGGDSGRHPQITTGHRGIAKGVASAPQSGTGRYEALNNVITSYNYGMQIKSYSAGWTVLFDAVGNVFQAGPNGNNKTPVLIRDDNYQPGEDPPLQGTVSIYAHDNRMTTGAVHAADCVSKSPDQYSHCDCDAVSSILVNQNCSVTTTLTNHMVRATKPQGSHAATEAAAATMGFVLPNAGATLPCRDPVDLQIVSAIASGAGLSFITAPTSARPDEMQACAQ
ncbi:MAG TPA: hypothetical protein VK714_08325 [Myxococcota bacterium]|nr:hypothetical protein [Myxococcota bacterium]